MSAVEIHLLPESEPSPEGFARKDPMHLGVDMFDEGSGAREDELVPQRERAEATSRAVLLMNRVNRLE